MINKADVRNEIANDLRALLVTSLALVQAVYAHRVPTPGGESPFVSVFTEGIDRPAMTTRGRKAVTLLVVEVWVKLTGAGMTSLAAEDLRDRLEYEVCKWLDENQKGTTYDSLQISQPTQQVDIVLDGVAWLVEDIFVGAWAV